MLRSRVPLTLFVSGFLATLALTQEMQPAGHSLPAFAQLKKLVGSWDGTATRSQKVHVTYQLISNGRVLMERLSPGNEPDMITTYTLQGDRILANHSCSAGNPPVMQSSASPAANGVYEFTFLRLDRAKSHGEGPMVGLFISLPDKDHMPQTWTFQGNGKSHSEDFSYTRKG